MKKNNLSARSIKFIERNNLENEKVKNYVISLMEYVFKFDEYYFKKHKKYGICLCVQDYMFFLDKEFVELKLFKKNKIEYIFYGDSCWYQGLKYIEGKLR